MRKGLWEMVTVFAGTSVLSFSFSRRIEKFQSVTKRIVFVKTHKNDETIANVNDCKYYECKLRCRSIHCEIMKLRTNYRMNWTE